MNTAQDRTKPLGNGPGLDDHAAHGPDYIDYFYLTGAVADTQITGCAGKQDVIGFISLHAQLAHPNQFSDIKGGSFHDPAPGAQAGTKAALHALIQRISTRSHDGLVDFYKGGNRHKQTPFFEKINSEKSFKLQDACYKREEP